MNPDHELQIVLAARMLRELHDAAVAKIRSRQLGEAFREPFDDPPPPRERHAA